MIFEASKGSEAPDPPSPASGAGVNRLRAGTPVDGTATADLPHGERHGTNGHGVTPAGHRHRKGQIHAGSWTMPNGAPVLRQGERGWSLVGVGSTFKLNWYLLDLISIIISTNNST